MLRASSRLEGKAVALRRVLDPATQPIGVDQEEVLIAFANAAVARQSRELAAARERLAARLGIDACVDAAVLVGNFERMNRIADACGIALGPLATMFQDIVRELDLAEHD